MNERKEQHILMCDDMVTATLEGLKWQTRRIIKPQPDHIEWFDHQKGWCARVRETPPQYEMVKCRYGGPGDRLWVKEGAWFDKEIIPDIGARRCFFANGEVLFSDGRRGWQPTFPRNDKTREERRETARLWAQVLSLNSSLRKRPSFLMPRWASRITLEIIDIRVQRVQCISLHDVLDEGFELSVPPDKRNLKADLEVGERFEKTWDALNAKRGYPWASNPWVWVIEFKQIGAANV